MITFSDNLPRLRFSHIFTRFRKDLEQLYYDDFFNVSLPVVRVALVLAFILYATFGLLDNWIVPLTKEYIWFIRYIIVCPIITIVFILTYTKKFYKLMQIAISFVGLAMGIGIAMMIQISKTSELGFKYYYAGLMLVIMWTYALARLRFINATIIAFLITASYEIIAIYFNKMLADSANRTVLINNNFFFISANIIGMLASFTIEFYLRKDFLLRTQIRKTNNLNQKYLSNIQEGLILIDHEYTILEQHSQYMSDLFKNDQINGMNFIDLIYPDQKKNAEGRKELQRFLSFLFNNKHADMDMILSINPLNDKKMSIIEGDIQHEIIIDAKFTRIYNRNDVELVMVIFENKTDIVKYQKELANEKNRHISEIESISAILKIGPESFIDFIKELKKSLNNIEAKQYQLTEPNVIDVLYREVHSLKGSAKYLGLNRISSLCHDIETAFDQVKSINVAKGSMGKIITAMKKLKQDLMFELNNLSQLITKFQQFSKLSMTSKSNDNKESLQKFLDSLNEMAGKIANELGKNIKLNITNTISEIPHLPMLKNPIIHLIRNTIDHGIEDPFERLSNNKDKTGNININIFKEGNNFNIIVEDDGRGINLKKIQQKAIEKNLIDKRILKPTKTQLLNIIFTPSFSSKEEASDISGRGYGLDIVKDTIEKLKGKISIATREKEGTKITLKVPE